MNWRNATTAASNAASYVTNVGFAATNGGFTRVANGDTTFLGRQDLIKYAQQATNSSGVAGDWTNALPYLTTFSRELNGATWGPTTPSGPAPYQLCLGAIHPRDYQSAHSESARARPTFARGTMDLTQRMSVSRWSSTASRSTSWRCWKNSPGTASASSAGSLTSSDITNIQKYFGLDLATNAAPYPIGPSYRHWNYPTTSTTYVHNAGTSGASGIMSLNDVAAQNREPDFFELLQAGILSGSLGVPGKNSTTGYPNTNRFDKYPVAGGNGPQPPNYVDPDDSKTLQTMRIGANIIDQWGAGNFPTTITYTPL